MRVPSCGQKYGQLKNVQHPSYLLLYIQPHLLIFFQIGCVCLQQLQIEFSPTIKRAMPLILL